MKNLELITRIKNRFREKGIIGNEDVVATQGFLKLIVPVTSAVSGVSWNILSNVGTTYAGERRLDITDMFTISHWGLYLQKTTDLTAANMASALLYTNPNSLVFTGASESVLLQSVYNSFLTVKVDREIVVDSIDTQRFYRAGVSQKGVLQVAASPWIADEWQGPNYGMAELDPEITLNGAGQNEITLTLPNATNLAGTATTNCLVLVCRGIKWQGVSKLNAR